MQCRTVNTLSKKTDGSEAFPAPPSKPEQKLFFSAIAFESLRRIFRLTDKSKNSLFELLALSVDNIRV